MFNDTQGDIVRHRAGLLVEEDDPPEVICKHLDSFQLFVFICFVQAAVFEPAPSPREREGGQKADTTPDPDVPPRWTHNNNFLSFPYNPFVPLDVLFNIPFVGVHPAWTQ